MLVVKKTIGPDNPTFLNYFGVDIPSSLGRIVVVKQTFTVENETNLKDVTHPGTQGSRRVTRRQLKGGVLISNEALISSSSAQTKKNVEIQTIFGVINSISSTEYKASKVVTAAAIPNSQIVFFRIFTASLKGIVRMPTWRITSGSTDKFVQRTKFGSKNLLLWLIANTSEISPEMIGIEW